ncbi:unnamed protein product [Nippostrongylus brasiliensis]|uniref:FCP1 homology domain-containing protein n=1 Tax=Nippostrongylus brasiliensis TaxID=27835 RepID=A0A158QWV5_NIPBR|nr:hypothetical protein Q1695_004552 [Nippostrongylus brasiliensis]VDL69437.1 unnamed protein product [Nippostrongylus brasiliensis]
MSLLYEDEFVEVNDSVVRIKNYHFPSKKTKCVSVEAITVLWFQEQDTCKCATKIWGKSPSRVYWALDVKRCIPMAARDRFNVVLDVNQQIRPGFTVADGEAFMDAMRSVLDYHVIIVDSINV